MQPRKRAAQPELMLPIQEAQETIQEVLNNLSSTVFLLQQIGVSSPVTVTLSHHEDDIKLGLCSGLAISAPTKMLSKVLSCLLSSLSGKAVLWHLTGRLV